MKKYSINLGLISNISVINLLTVAKAFIILMLCACISCNVTDDNDVQSDLEQAKLLFGQLMEHPDNMTIIFPDQDPGIPIYARVAPILNQFFVTDGQLVIPFYRVPECIREDFNFLSYFDPPTAFGCELTVKGKFVIETDAEEGTFPIMAHVEGLQVPVWIFDWLKFQDLLEKEWVTITDLEDLNPIKGLALQYDEYLSPRMHEHEVIIEAGGTILSTGQSFTFSLTHRGDQIERISLIIEE